MRRVAIETVIPVLVGVGLCGYAAFRVARAVWRGMQQAFVEFVSG